MAQVAVTKALKRLAEAGSRLPLGRPENQAFLPKGNTNSK
jgi:hypothetical protein